MTDVVYNNVQMGVRKRDGQGTYELGAWIDGAFAVFAARKTGGIDDDIAFAHAEGIKSPASPLAPDLSPIEARIAALEAHVGVAAPAEPTPPAAA